MSISQIMSTCVAECTEDASLDQVYELIRKFKHGVVVVVDSEVHRVPIGVVTERSICDQIILRGKNPRNLPAGSVLDSNIKIVREADGVESVSPQERDTLAAIIVTNERRQVCGIVPKEKIGEIPTKLAVTHSPGHIYVNTSARSTPATREIPAFGWIQ